MEKARIYIYENGKRAPYFVDRVDRKGAAVKRPLEITRAECQELRAAQPHLFDSDNPHRIEMVCKCCGKPVEEGVDFRVFDLAAPRHEIGADARGKPGFVHADEDDRTACPGSLALHPRFRDYFTDDSFDILEKERRKKLPGNSGQDAIGDLLLGLVGGDAYAVESVYRLMLSGLCGSRKDRFSREYHGVGIQKLPFFVDDEEKFLLVPIKLQLRYVQGGNVVKVKGAPVEYDFSERFWSQGPIVPDQPACLLGVGSGKARLAKPFIGAKLGT